jgi:hypothetical protein
MAEMSYKEESSPSYGEEAARSWTYEYLPTGRPDHIAFDGTCPKCAHESTYRWPLFIIREDFEADQEEERGQGSSATKSQPEPIVVRCQCSTDHPGSNGEKGCGRYWTLMVLGP